MVFLIVDEALVEINPFKLFRHLGKAISDKWNTMYKTPKKIEDVYSETGIERVI